MPIEQPLLKQNESKQDELSLIPIPMDSKKILILNLILC